MRIDPHQIDKLKIIVKNRFDLELSDEQAQEAGFAILRFYVSKQLRDKKSKAAKNGNGNKRDASRPI